jgi:hypothetical protein
MLLLPLLLPKELEENSCLATGRAAVDAAGLLAVRYEAMLLVSGEGQLAAGSTAVGLLQPRCAGLVAAVLDSGCTRRARRASKAASSCSAAADRRASTSPCSSSRASSRDSQQQCHVDRQLDVVQSLGLKHLKHAWYRYEGSFRSQMHCTCCQAQYGM